MKPRTTTPSTSSSERFSNKKLRSLTERAVVNLLRTWQEVRGSARMLIGSKAIRPSLPEEDKALLVAQIQACLEPKGGEVTARANTVELGKQYLELDETGRQRFFTLLAALYDVDHEAVKRLAQSLGQAKDIHEQRGIESKLQTALHSSRMTLFRQFNALPDGFKFLVDMRAEMLDMLKEYPEIAPVEQDLKQVLSAWFDVGLLDMVELSWQSPAELLEKLMQYEAVHAMHSWEDLKNRLDKDRRIFAFFHNKMPMEPLIFVEVAFWDGLATSIQEVLDIHRPAQEVNAMSAAMFYSISNAQKGLAGISFGNFLIKRVAARLTQEVPHIKHFATLSPIPGFAQWLNKQMKEEQGASPLFTKTEEVLVCSLSREVEAKAGLQKILKDEWYRDKTISEAKAPSGCLCARYLAEEKRGGKALDPVAHFHLSNGARMEQLNWLADTSAKGIKQSLGMMVNYYYHQPDIDDNHEDYVTDGKIHTSKAVQQWLKT